MGKVEGAVRNDGRGQVVHDDGLGNGYGPLGEALENISKRYFNVLRIVLRRAGSLGERTRLLRSRSCRLA